MSRKKPTKSAKCKKCIPTDGAIFTLSVEFDYENEIWFWKCNNCGEEKLINRRKKKIKVLK